jgi:hypothetical protein
LKARRSPTINHVGLAHGFIGELSSFILDLNQGNLLEGIDNKTVTTRIWKVAHLFIFVLFSVTFFIA